jgi:hypothetical protein
MTQSNTLGSQTTRATYEPTRWRLETVKQRWRRSYYTFGGGLRGGWLDRSDLLDHGATSDGRRSQALISSGHGDLPGRGRRDRPHGDGSATRWRTAAAAARRLFLS